MNNIYYFNRHIVGLAIGYSKAIVVDMAFCLQVTLLTIWTYEEKLNNTHRNITLVSKIINLNANDYL